MRFYRLEAFNYRFCPKNMTGCSFENFGKVSSEQFIVNFLSTGVLAWGALYAFIKASNIIPANGYLNH